VEPPSECEDYSVEVQSAAADVLVVLDRSGSMRDLTVNRWDPSVAALEELTEAIPGTVRLGLMTFPGDCLALPTLAEQTDCLARQGSLLGDLSCEPGQLKVSPAHGSAAAIRQQLHATAPNGATPTAATLRAAHEALKELMTQTGTQTVLLVTDGAPNCAFGDQGGLGSVGIGKPASGQPEAVPQTVAAIEAMAKDGIKTYVLGYDTQHDATLRAALDAMAQAGGTGETAHTPVESHATLKVALQNLTGRAADCELVLKSRVVDPWKVQVTLDGEILTVDDANGYALDAEGDNLTLLGASCDAVRDDLEKHVLRVAAVCPPPAPEEDTDAGVELPDAGDEGPRTPVVLYSRSGCSEETPPARDAGRPEPVLY
jgi:Mg-chelatase subunit ChlD